MSKQIRFLTFRGQRGQRGFVFLAALGAMAVLILVAGSANMAALQAYRGVGQGALRAQAELAIRSGLANLTTQTLTSTPSVVFEKGPKDGSSIDMQVSLSRVGEIQADHPVYARFGFQPKPGDTALKVTATLQKQKQPLYIVNRTYFWNPNRSMKQPLEIPTGK